MIKRRIIPILIAIAVLMAIAIFSVFFRKSDNSIIVKIPFKAKTVLIIDFPGLSKKLFVDDLGKETKSRSKLIKAIPDSIADVDFEKSGLSFSDKIAFFTLEDSISSGVSIHFIIKVISLKDFNVFADTLCQKFNAEIEKSGKIHFLNLKTLDLLLAWENDYVVAKLSPKKPDIDKNVLARILKTTKEQSIMMEPGFENLLNKNYDLFLYSKSYENLPVKDLVSFNQDIEHIAAFVNFNDGLIEISSGICTKKGSLTDNLFNVNSSASIETLNSDSGICSLHMNVNPNSLFKILDTYLSLRFNENSFPIFKAWSGLANIALSGIKVIENEYITYEYDDDFNKIEIKKQKQTRTPELLAIVKFDTFKFDSLLKSKQIAIQGKDTLLYSGGNYLVRKIKDNYLIYNKLLDRPKLNEQSINPHVYIEANYKKLYDILKELGLETGNQWLKNLPLSSFTISIEKLEDIRLTCNFYFMDKKKNAFFGLFDNVDINEIK